MGLQRPFFPIIYVRGYAGSQGAVEAATPDPRALSVLLGCEVVAVNAPAREGLDELTRAVAATLVLLANWFPRTERARANCYWNLCQPIAVVMSAPLSGFILDAWVRTHWAQTSGWGGWRVMLVLEGALPFFSASRRSSAFVFSASFM